MRRGMGRVPLMTAPPMAYPAITMTDKYANPADERGKESDVPQSRVLCVFHTLPCTLLYPTAYVGCVPKPTVCLDVMSLMTSSCG
jgi:hypothetical protein